MQANTQLNLGRITASIWLLLLCSCGGGGTITDLSQTHKLSTAVRFLRAKYDQPALGAALINGDRVQQAVDGVRKYGEAAPVTLDDYFHIGSNLKAMSAVMIGRLIEDHRLAWTTRPTDAIPALAESMDPGYAEITLSELLDHTAGLPALDELEDLLAVPPFTGSPVEQRLAFTAWIMSEPPAGTVGEYVYSNAGYIVLATLAEQATGTPWDVLMQSEVYAPLGITARIGWPAESDPNQPWGHQEFDGVIEPHDPLFVAEQMPDWLTPAGDVSFRLNDYVKFIQVFLDALRGEPTIIPTEMVTKLNTTSQEYALGWAVSEEDQVRTYWHDGSAGTFYTVAIIQPSLDRAAVIITNAVIDGTGEALTELQEWMAEQP